MVKHPTPPRRNVVVDGSNIATEGRTVPSLRQLDEAVRAFIAENPHDLITVVVDATFGHRIDPAEHPTFEAAVEHNELVTPPAGAIGRGDAFVLVIADKANATILSNDSFQEFHGQYPWLFDEGRLIGGKPVPHIGWVFVNRVPVRGPVSRRAVRSAKRGERKSPAELANRRPSRDASKPMPVPTAPPPAPRRERRHRAGAPAEPTVADVLAAVDAQVALASAPGASAGGTGAGGAARPSGRPPAKGEPINAPLPFLEFVPAHPVGSVVTATVDSFSSHGAYLAVGDVRCYLPLRSMGDPPPRAARHVVNLGQELDVVVVSFDPGRRGVDVALPGFAPAEAVLAAAEGVAPTAAPVAEAPAPGRRARRGAGVAAGRQVEAAPAEVAAPKARRARKAAPAVAEAAPAAEAPVSEAPAPEAPAKARRARKAAVGAAPAEPVAPLAGVPPAPAPAPAKATRARKAAEAAPAEPATPAPAPSPRRATQAAKEATPAPAKAAAPARAAKVAKAAAPARAAKVAKAAAPAKAAKVAKEAAPAKATAKARPGRASKEAAAAKPAARVAKAAGTAKAAGIAKGTGPAKAAATTPAAPRPRARKKADGPAG